MDEKTLLQGRFRDLANRAYTNGYPVHTGFLTPAEQEILRAMTRSENGGAENNMLSGVKYLFYGGYEDAERRTAVFLPDYMDEQIFLESEEQENVTVACLQVQPLNRKFTDKPTHRDYLGALMNLGIRRDQVGDIIAGEETAFVFLMGDISEYVREEITRVRHTSVMAEKVSASSCEVHTEYEVRQGSVSSERIDSVIAMAWNLSRATAQTLIQRELVLIDGRIEVSASKPLRPGNRVSARGYGKFIYDGILNKTRKGRCMIQVRLYK